MSCYKGKNLSVSIFGESHGNAIGVVINGFPHGEVVSFEALEIFLKRRAPGRSSIATGRKEPDVPKFLSGIKEGVTEGSPICAVIENTDNRSKDYQGLQDTPRPGHSDYGAYMRFKGFADMRGGGHFSGRLTAPLCVAGGIAKQILERRGIYVVSHISSIAKIYDDTFESVGYDKDKINFGNITVLNPKVVSQMEEEILAAKTEGDSVGGTVECMILGMPPGKGGLIFEGMESRISYGVFGIPGVKGIDFGNGFDAAILKGSENNDSFSYKNGRIITDTNRHGGILGGISTGMPIVFRVGIKPTPTIAKEQRTINIQNGENTIISTTGRHDPCIVPRVLPPLESVAAIVALDLILERNENEFNGY